MEFATMTDAQLYHELRVVDRLRSREGRGRSPEVAAVRHWCTQHKRLVQRELRRRNLPAARADGRWTGIGRGFLAGEVAP
jgi:hypothetical protein